MPRKTRISLPEQAIVRKPALARALCWQVYRAGPLVAAFGLALCGGCADTFGRCDGRLSRINVPTPVHAVSRATASPTPVGVP